MDGSKKFQLNKEDGAKILKGALMAIGGALLTYITQTIGDIDFGTAWTPIIVALGGILVNTAHKWITDHTT